MHHAETSGSGTPRRKIVHKLTAIFFFFAVAVSGLITFALYETASNQVMNDIRQRLRDIVSVAVPVVDVNGYLKLTDPAQDGSPEFLAVRRSLQKIRDAATDVKYIYTLRQEADGTILFVVDGESNPDDAIPLFHPYDDASPLLRARFAELDAPLVEENFYTDEWGTWLSGYAPFYAEDGTRAGILGLDISAATVKAYKRTLLLRALGIFALILPLLLLTGLWLGRRISAPIIAMKEGAERIGQDDLDVRVDIDSDDEIGSLAHSLNEMTEKLSLNRKKLNELAAKYRNIFDNANEGIFQTSHEGRFLTANASLARMLGYTSPEELIESVTNMSTQVYADPNDRLIVRDMLKRDGRLDNHKVQFRRKDGSTIWVELSVHLTKPENGNSVIEGMLLDITGRLEKEQAEKERQAAEAASQAKSEFLANMSHEIRTPLNAVMGLTDLLMRTEGTPKQIDYFRKIRSSSQALLSVINDILDFSKIEAGRLELERVNFSLYEVMANITEMFSHRAHDQDIELLVSIDEAVPCALKGDPVRLGQVLINLTGNALKFTPKGEIVVQVRLAPDNDPSQDKTTRLEFEVRDTGIGIAPDRVDSIFDSFTQADSSTTRQYGGTGLGLSICKQITRLMGGEIRAESEQGKGSRFIFTAEFGKQPSQEAVRPSTPKDLRGLRVLVVDDNKTARDILVAAISSFQMEALAVGSGPDAIQAVSEADPPFDMVLLDWKMPGMNGLETARNIKRDQDLLKMPIVCMISAYGREDLIQQADKSFLDAFLHKPVNQSFLFDTIMELFGRSSATTQSNKDALTTEDLTPAAHLTGASVLLVEDNEINREVAQEWLKLGRLQIRIAENGRRALEELAREDLPLPDVVLMDVQMPELDGLEATRRIRVQERLRALPIIAMTAHALKGDRERCLEAGMSDYITKPIDPRQLFAALERWVPDTVRAQDPEPGRQPQEEAAMPVVDHDLPGLSRAEGLFRCNNNTKLYSKLLATFLRDFAEASERIEQLLAEDDVNDARIIAHSIKGVGGSIGAGRLSASAAAVEAELMQRNLDTSSEMWNEFRMALLEVTNGLVAAGFDRPRMATPQTCTDAGAAPRLLAAKLTELAALLEDDLSRATQLFEELANDVRCAAGDELYNRLAEQIDAFEIDEAAQTVADIRNRLGEASA
ncbi:MAG: response regulator [Desulfovibrionaceae bacterium]